MLSLFVSITKDSEYLDLTYYKVETNFSDEQTSNEQLVKCVAVEDLLESFLSKIEYWDNFNKVTITVTNDDDLRNDLMRLTKQVKAKGYQKLLNKCLPTTILKDKYKYILTKYQVEVI